MAVDVERVAVLHWARRIVVVEVDAQHVGTAHMGRIGGVGRGVGLDHLEPCPRLDMKVRAANADHGVVELNRGRAHAQHAVAVAGDGARTQPELNRVALGQRLAGPQQHPNHHSLHVFQLDRQRLADAHGSLHPRRAQVQVAHTVGFGDGGRGQFGSFFLLVHRDRDVATLRSGWPGRVQSGMASSQTGRKCRFPSPSPTRSSNLLEAYLCAAMPTSKNSTPTA